MANSKFVNVTGLSEGGVAAVISRMEEAVNLPLLVVTENAKKARQLASDFEFFKARKGNTYILGENTDSFFAYEARDTEGSASLICALFGLLFEEEATVFIPAGQLLKKLPNPDIFKTKTLTFRLGDELNLGELKERLVENGYERVNLVEAKGQFAVRGSIVDIFAPSLENPIRIELFDTEIDLIKFFDKDTQRAKKTLKNISITPSSLISGGKEHFEAAFEKIAKDYDDEIKKLKRKKNADELSEVIENLEKTRESLEEAFLVRKNIQLAENYIKYFCEDTANIWDYLPKEAICVVDDFDRVEEALHDRGNELKLDFETMLESGKLISKDLDSLLDTHNLARFFEEENLIVFTPFLNRLKGIERRPDIKNIPFKQGVKYNGRMQAFISDLKHYIDQDYYITIACKDSEREKAIKELLDNYKVNGRIVTRVGALSSSFEFPEKKELYICEEFIFSLKTFTTKFKSQKKSKTLDENRKIFIELQKGDYVVHEEYGIGKFIGIEEMSIESEKKDYLKIKYAGTDMVYVPVENMGIIQKYIGGDTENIRVSKLGGADWKAAKAKAKLAVEDMAEKLLELSATRKIEPGYAFSKDTEWQIEFENDFPYVETQDQLRCIKEIKADMEKPLPMDRLLCGDVGYGKTEVAARALFKCIADGKQAAVLVPTTLLASQHYITLKERFEKFPCKIDLLCRFRTEKEQKKTIEGIEAGSVDLVIGTHRILSDDVKFKDLGLLVVDEEQRFGVSAKEKLKMLSKNVDVLTMSATPIPRTLHMSLVGIKNMSLIEEPPGDRYPVQTYVLEQEDEILKTSIQREVNRGGQVYVIYNRVRGIEKLVSHLRELLPDLTIDSAHGRMKESGLEKRMLKFMNGETQVLVATTILESGIDIPNANTMIILDADMFGLSQLYQLRGRVGRSNRLAYAYLMFKKDKIMSEVAEKRLRAIKEFTEFGAGFKVAMKDLEIRGAGNILGATQHGHIVAIGYELYCKLVDDAIKRIGGGNVEAKALTNTVLEIRESAYIPSKYIIDEVQKIQMYRRIASISSIEDKEDIIDELIDRFGKIPKDTLNLIEIALIRSMAARYGIAKIRQEGNSLLFDLDDGCQLEMQQYGALSEKFGKSITIYASQNVKLKYSLQRKPKMSDITNFLEVLDLGGKTDVI